MCVCVCVCVFYDAWMKTQQQEYEQVVALVDAVVLTPTLALELCANEPFTDAKGRARKTGERYLVTMADTDAYIPDVREAIVSRVPLVTLTKQQVRAAADARRRVVRRRRANRAVLCRRESWSAKRLVLRCACYRIALFCVALLARRAGTDARPPPRQSIQPLGR